MIDLHTHSAVSDGTDPPERIPALAKRVGCSAVALTDHDTMAGLAAARQRAEQLDIELVPGCEVSCAFGHQSAHVLVYFAAETANPLHEELERLRSDRVARNRALAERLRELELPVTYEEALAGVSSETSLGRLHFARLLVAKGAAGSVEEVFDRWLAQGRPAYVPKARVSPESIARLARDSGGVAVLAHPLSLGMDWDQLEAALDEFRQAGFVGIEAIYGGYAQPDRQRLAALAANLDLVATGGSDYHGAAKADLAVGTGHGDLSVPEAILEALRDRRP